MTRFYITLIIALLTVSAARAASLSFSGSRLAPVEVSVNATTGLDALYVLHDLDGVSATVSGLPAGANVKWSKWGYMGAAYAEAIDASLISTSGTSSTISSLEADCGYAVDYGADTYYFWITDYSRHPFRAEALSMADEQDCSTANLVFSGTADRITYYSINARSNELNREIRLSYRTLERDEERVTFTPADAVETLAYVGQAIHVDAPLCDTDFRLEGDRFLRAWGMEQSVSTPVVSATAVDVITAVEQELRENANEIKVEGTTLGGSAPVEVTFRGAVTDAAVYHEWQMARDDEFYEIIYRNRDLDFTYTFTEMGNIYVRLLAANASGSCEAQNDPYVVNVSESALRCPNAFSPGSSEGVNDEWRVSYKSIVSFECYIFDRWGTKMAEFNNPAQGWDGKYRGKYVPAGVYYYVIKARGSDGKNYNLSGDINILKSKR